MDELVRKLREAGGVRRSSSISLIRLISLAFIITCHIMQWYNLELAWWFNAGVQIFLCISGYLYGQKDVGEVTAFYHRRFKKILIPYLLVFVLYGILQFLFAKDVFIAEIFLKGLFVNATLKGAGHLWFVHTILICYVLTPLLEAYRNKWVKNTKSWILFLLLGVEIASLFFGAFDKFFNPAWISCYVMGYALGINEKHKWIKSKIMALIFGAIAAIGNCIQIYCSYIAHKNFTGYQIFCNYNHMMLGVFLFLAMKLLFDRVNLERIEGFLSFTDKYSYEMYLVHHLIILGPFSLMALTSVTSLNIMIILVLTVLLAWFLKLLSDRIQMLLFKKGST